jgi:hypothetical protein
MKQLKFLIILAGLGLSVSLANGQDVSAKLNEAESAYNSKNYENARFALQEALTQINQLIGKDILALLPAKMGAMAVNSKEDNVTGAAGFAGLSVTRNYGTEEKTARVEIIGDSPMVASLNALMSMPMLMGASDPNQKRVKVGEYKGMLQKETSENTTTGYTLQVPLSQTLFTLHVTGSFTENEVMAMAQSIPVGQIAKIAQ